MARIIGPERRALPLAEWPTVDQRAWKIAIAKGDLLDGNGRAAHWAARTKQTNLQHYSRWLGYLLWQGILDPNQLPENRVNATTVGAYNRHLDTLVAPVTKLSTLVGLKVMMQAMASDQSWRWLQDLCNWVQRNAEPRRDKRSRIRPSAEIYRAALQELATHESGPLSLDHAITYRDALMLAVLVARPLRMKNFASIVIGHHLIAIDGHWLLAFQADETKTHQPIEFFLPDELTMWLERYIQEVRPILPGASTTSRLWLGKENAPLAMISIYDRIVKLTTRLLGNSINPHLLRDCAASSLALDSPDAARAAASLLGHQHFSTTERYYVQANNLEASRRFNGILARVKASSGNSE